MKVDATLLQELKSEITPMLTQKVIESYESGNFPRSEKVKDLNVRFMFDLFYSTSQTLRDKFKDMNDSHIQTALKQVVPRIERRY